MKYTHRTMLAATLLAVGALTACSKKENLIYTPPPPVQGELMVSFINGSIPVNSIDSIIAEFSRTDAPDKRFVKLQREGSNYRMRLAAIPVGQWRISVTVHAQKGDYDFPRQYQLARAASLPASSHIALVAPNGRIDGEWNVRAVINEIATGVSAIVAVNPADPYFEVSMRQLRLKHLMVDRRLSRRLAGGYQNVFAQDFNKSLDNGWLGYTDFEHFRPLATAARTSSWNKFETYLTLIDENNREYTAYYLYQQ
ncbi:MAG: hypothetical protein MUF62_13070 [Chitinophagaceae bacterium]|nr:hypothetical protein [Chitinophagaceae bacterium]